MGRLDSVSRFLRTTSTFALIWTEISRRGPRLSGFADQFAVLFDVGLTFDCGHPGCFLFLAESAGTLGGVVVGGWVGRSWHSSWGIGFWWIWTWTEVFASWLVVSGFYVAWRTAHRKNYSISRTASKLYSIILCEDISAGVGVEGEERQFFRVLSSVIVNLKCFDKKFLASDSISLLAVWIEWLGLHLSAVLSRFWLSRVQYLVENDPEYPEVRFEGILAFLRDNYRWVDIFLAKKGNSGKVSLRKLDSINKQQKEEKIDFFMKLFNKWLIDPFIECTNKGKIWFSWWERLMEFQGWYNTDYSWRVQWWSQVFFADFPPGLQFLRQ